jgi:ATP-dependent exoDNAse (exonuclease V) alpha subunit
VQADHETPVLVPKPDMTGIDRAYADRYDVGDTVRYTKGSLTLGLDPGSDAVVTARECDTNAITVRRADGQVVTYDPRRLRGVTVYEAETRAFAVGDRVQFTARSAPLGVANRDLGTIAALADGQVRITLDAGRDVTFAVGTHPHLDFGYAVTSHAAQSQTVDRVLVHVDTDRAAESIVNQRLAYVAPSRGRDDMQILTDNGAALWHALSRDVSHRAAIERAPTPQQAHVPGPQQGLTRP